MNIRVFLVIPAAVAVAVLAGCGAGVSEAAKKAAPAQIQMPSTEVCHQSEYIRERAPEGFCAESADVKVDDDLSPLGGVRAYRLDQ